MSELTDDEIWAAIKRNIHSVSGVSERGQILDSATAAFRGTRRWWWEYDDHYKQMVFCQTGASGGETIWEPEDNPFHDPPDGIRFEFRRIEERKLVTTYTFEIEAGLFNA